MSQLITMRWGRWVIEGFYGQTWSWQARRDMASYLPTIGFNGYIYAPKADAFLRKSWRNAWPADQYQQLKSLRDFCKIKGVSFGVGLSPFEVYRGWGSAARDDLQQKLDEILTLEPDGLCLLFDDMRGDFPDVAAIQADIANYAQRHCQKPILLCPTYYSFDPILEQLFGQRPKEYWSTLGRHLDEDISILWTGDRVISPELGVDGIRDITDQLGRKPVIWDNVVANDGRKSSPFLPLQSVCERAHAVSAIVDGHLFNPMNQPYLSQLVLKTASYRHCANSLQKSFFDSMDSELATQIDADLDLFRDVGLDGIDELQRRRLVAIYSKFEAPHARDVLQWLEGHYRFDPQCLTG